MMGISIFSFHGGLILGWVISWIYDCFQVIMSHSILLHIIAASKTWRIWHRGSCI
ncbi:heat shock 70 kDa protein 16-like [Iris pallida]|uniref:Heat shock 70 kDa protein 16-like n=1 Tax=Iris pallida TaxID=29817 RepID=A0AAX6DZK2_IRIPA|nr:heat shock 70 kDa protein 16-like [Iris pallida]